MCPQLLGGLPPLAPPGGGAVASAATALAGPPVRFRQPPEPFDPEAPDNPLLTFLVADGVEILEATVSPRGSLHVADLKGGAAVVGGQALIDLGGLRPVTRIDFTRGNLNTSNKLMIQLGGVWHVPAPAGAVTSFETYGPNTPFPELITEQVLIANVGTVREVESRTFPSNVTLRLTDGGVPFFFQRGSLRAERVHVPDFGDRLGLSIRDVESIDGVRAIDLVAHSDTFGTITLDAARVACRVVDNSLAGLSLDARTRTIPADGSVSFDVPVPEGLTLPEDRPAVTAVTLALLAIGFGPTFAPATLHRGAIVSAEFGVAQAVDVVDGLTTSTLNLYLLRRTPKATLTVELRADVDGEPRGEVLASAPLDATGLPDGAFGWLGATLAAPLTLEAGARVWLALRANAGEVEWGGDDVPAGGSATLFSADRGNTWQAHPMTAAYAFVRDLPDPAAPLMIRLRAEDEQQVVPYDPSAFPFVLDAASPLVRGMNALVGQATGGEAGSPLPAELGLTLSADPAVPLQVTLTQLDVTYAQTEVSAASLSGGTDGIRGRPGSERDVRHVGAAEHLAAIGVGSGFPDADQAGW